MCDVYLGIRIKSTMRVLNERFRCISALALFEIARLGDSTRVLTPCSNPRTSKLRLNRRKTQSAIDSDTSAAKEIIIARVSNETKLVNARFAVATLDSIAFQRAVARNIHRAIGKRSRSTVDALAAIL